MHTDTRIQRPDAAHLARFDATRTDVQAVYSARLVDTPVVGRHRPENVATMVISTAVIAAALAARPARVAVPSSPARMPGDEMRRPQRARNAGGFSVLTKIRNSIGRRFRP